MLIDCGYYSHFPELVVEYVIHDSVEKLIKSFVWSGQGISDFAHTLKYSGMPFPPPRRVQDSSNMSFLSDTV